MDKETSLYHYSSWSDILGWLELEHKHTREKQSIVITKQDMTRTAVGETSVNLKEVTLLSACIYSLSRCLLTLNNQTGFFLPVTANRIGTSKERSIYPHVLYQKVVHQTVTRECFKSSIIRVPAG